MEPLRDTGLPNLREALRRARSDSAERSGVLVELRTAELARLDLLKERLEPIFAQVPDEIDLFDAAILPGDPARLFVDVLGFVEMDRDKRTYRFFQDTRNGRQLLAESEDLAKITQSITDYVAYRMVEREKALASDVPRPRPEPAQPAPPVQPSPRRSALGWLGLLLVVLVAASVGFIAAGVLLQMGSR
ncbi:hypothetical protein [Terrihabitans sp. B22-R8]|uniref:hypothetical protein n=1 Tax=Terrihabitans sp. B22-R8 TaxID=3425128 RepID=UPI00403C6FDD